MQEKRKIKSRLSLLYDKKKRKYPRYKRQKRNLEDIWFHLYDSKVKSDRQPLGHTFEMSVKHKSIEINEQYCYFSEKDFNKVMKHLKKFVDFYFKSIKQKD